MPQRLTLDDYHNIIEICKTPITTEQLAGKINRPRQTVYAHLIKMLNAGILFKDGTRHQSKEGVSKSVIKRAFKAKRKVGKPHKKYAASTSKSYAPKDRIDRTEVGVTKVSINDYHTRIERVRPRVYAGTSEGIV